MATHSSVLAWRIPGTGEPGGLLSVGLHRVGHDWSDLAAAAASAAAFFMVQLSHPYMTIGKTIALTTWTFAGKVKSLLFNRLSRLAMAFLPRSKHLSISFQLSYFKSLKMMLWKCCTQYANKFGKCSSGHRTGKGQLLFQSQRQCQRVFKLRYSFTHFTC